MRVRHDEDLELVLGVQLGLAVVLDVPALLPCAAVGVVEADLVVDVGHADVALRRRRLREREVALGDASEGLVGLS